MFFVPMATLAQNAPATEPVVIRGGGDTGAKPQPDLVKVFNRPIIVLHATVYGSNPSDRVRAIEQRISDLVAQDKFKNLTVRPTAEGTLIESDGELVMLITPADIDPFSGGTLDETVQSTLRRLQLALNSMQEQYSVRYLLRASAATLVATLLYVGFIWVAGRIKVWLWTQIGRGRKVISKTLGNSGTTVLPQLQVIYQWIVRIFYWVLVLAATDYWLTFCLRQFPYTAPWGEALGNHLIGMLRTLLSGVVSSLPDLFVVVVILVVTRLLAKLVRMFFSNVRERRIHVSWLAPDSARPTGRIVQFVIWAFAVVMMYPYLPGSGSAAFKGVGVFLGLLVSLGGTGLISQVMGGFVLMYTRTLKVGEYVHIGEHEGTVESIGFMSTRLRSRKNEVINIPNALLMGIVTTNYSRLAEKKGVMASTTVTIGYDAPWRQVHAMLLRAAEKTAGLRRPPEPFVWQRSLSDFYVEYELNVNLEDPEQRLPVLSALCANIQDEFNEHGVQILSPHFMMNPPGKVWVPKEKWHEPPADSGKKGDGQDDQPSVKPSNPGGHAIKTKVQ
jgi:small-conductance mechanosensitive channel